MASKEQLENRDNNKAIVLSAIDVNYETPFSKIMQRTGKSRHTVYEAVNRLIRDGSIIVSREELIGGCVRRYFIRKPPPPVESRLWAQWGGFPT
jgi:DNA-binding Lrp family transcriptional regulator